MRQTVHQKIARALRSGSVDLFLGAAEELKVITDTAGWVMLLLLDSRRRFRSLGRDLDATDDTSRLFRLCTANIPLKWGRVFDAATWDVWPETIYAPDWACMADPNLKLMRALRKNHKARRRFVALKTLEEYVARNG